MFAKAEHKIDGSGLSKWADHRRQSSMDLKFPGTIDLLFCDSLPLLRYRKLKLNTVG
jgi:hypothetical protein